MIVPSVRTLLTAVIDYAGLFPPAKLPLEQSLRNHARYRSQPEGWLLGRFIIPAARLGELAPYQDILASGQPSRFSVLGRGGETAGDFLKNLETDLRDVIAFREEHGDRVVVDVLEVRLPGGVIGSGDAEVSALVSDVARLIEELGPPSLQPFYEIPARPAWSDFAFSVLPVLTALSSDSRGPQAEGRRKCRAAGFKLRCGGLDAASFPPTSLVAHVLFHARRRLVPLKFTAGLHHPLRHLDPGVKTFMHGFLNALVAGVVGHFHDLPEQTLQEILEVREAREFSFDDTGLSWRGHRVDLEDIDVCRDWAVLSFGSCSFDEPRDDLRGLGLL